MTSPAIGWSDQNADNSNDNVPENQQEKQQDASKTLTLTLDSSSAPDPPEIPDQIDDPQTEIVSDDPDQTETLTLDASSPPVIDDSHVKIAVAKSSTMRNRTKQKKKKVYNRRKKVFPEKKWAKKAEELLEKFKPVPFVPAKSLDFVRHEALLKRLGLWDFVHMEFDRDVRADLVTQLIASFSSVGKFGYVNGCRIRVTRADLARALNLPVKNVRGNSTEIVPIEEESNDNESKRFMEDFLSTYVLLHDDTWILPSEILNWTNMVKEGEFEKVDWAGLIWFMAEQEFKECDGARGLETSYYASHMQCLIKFQRKQLLAEETRAETDVIKEDDDVKTELEELKVGPGDAEDVIVEISEQKLEDVIVEISDQKLEDVRIEASNMKMDDVKIETSDTRMEVDDLKVETRDATLETEDMQLEIAKDVQEQVGDIEMERNRLLEEHSIELSLGGKNDAASELLLEKGQKENVCAGDHSDAMMGFEECKDDEEEQGGQDEQRRQWLFGESSILSDSFLQRCNLGLSEFEEERKAQEDDENEQECHEEEIEDGGFHISPNRGTLDDMTPANLISSMEDVPNPFGTRVQIRDNMAGDFLAGNASEFANGNKRGIEHDNDLSHDSFNGSNKRVRTHSPWEDKSADASQVLDQAQYFMGKARNIVAAKEQALEDANMNQQILLNEMQARDVIIEQLQKAKIDEQLKSHMEVSRLDNELCTMGKLLESYRKALKETQRAFSEYREQRPVSDEPLYKDIPGSGGFVLSVMEIEKQHMKQEEEERMNRIVVEKMFREFEDDWIIKLEAFENRVHLLDSKLLNTKKEAILIKESFAKHPKSDVPVPEPECAAPEDA